MKRGYTVYDYREMVVAPFDRSGSSRYQRSSWFLR